MEGVQQKEKYPLTKDFEALVVLAVASVPRFYEVIGYALDAERMPSAPAKLLVEAAQAVARETPGAGCASAVFAVQHLRSMCGKGKLTYDQVDAAQELLQLARDLGGVPDTDALIARVTPIVQRLAHRETVSELIQDFGKGSDLDESVQKLEKVALLGKQRGSLGLMLTGTVADIVSVTAPTKRQKLPVGIPELDHLLDGGLERPALGMVMGGTGAGKSLFLCHLAACSVFSGYDVAYMTLELSEAQVAKRIYANLTDMSDAEMVDNPQEANRRIELLRSTDGMGKLAIRYDTPKATTPHTLRRWLRELEREKKLVPEIVIVDYADKMSATARSGNSNVRAYEEMEQVYESLRSIAVDREGWMWTASQTNKGGLHKKKVDLEHTADSINKPRVCDVVIAIARTAEDEAEGLIRFRVPKRREGVAHQEVGPMAMDASRGRIAMIARKVPW